MVLPPDMPQLPSPHYQLDGSPPKWSEVQLCIVQEPHLLLGPTAFPTALQAIPTAWRRASGVLIPKERNSSMISQFRHISLLNVEGKIVFSIVARRLAGYLETNGYIDTTMQKAGISGFSGCLEHASMIWFQIQAAKKEGRDLHVVFLDLANAFGSVPHNLLWTAFTYFNVPGSVTNLVKAYFQDIQLCLLMEEFDTAWQALEVGIMAGCTISPLAFTMAMEVIIRASR